MFNKLNCWEFKKCGKEITRDCPVVERNVGKMCWMIAGTLCDGKVQGMFAEKVGTCRQCEYYSYMQH